MAFQAFANNAALLLSLGLLYSFISRRCQGDQAQGRILNGLLFGAAAIGVMANPMQLTPGVMADTRSILVSVAGLFGGPLTAGVAIIIAGAYRIAVGGIGALTGVTAIFISGALGVAYHYWRKNRPQAMKPLYLYGFGLAVHAVMLACLLILPWPLAWRLLQKYALPTTLIFPLVSLLLSLLLYDRESRIRSELALKESEARYRDLVTNASEGILVARGGTIKYVNPALCKMTGYEPEELIGRSFEKIIHPDDRAMVLKRHRLRMMGQDLPNIYTFRALGKDGRPWPVEINAVSFTWEGRPATLTFITDIAERVQAEEEKARLEEQLRQSQKMEAIGALAGGIAHDFNNILAAIIGYTELAHEDALNGITSPDELEQALKAAERAKELVWRILTFSRKTNLETAPLDLNQVVSAAADLLRRTLPKMISVEQNLSPDIKTVNGDANQLEQALMNIGTNAKDAMPEGGKILMSAANAFIENEVCMACGQPFSGDYVRIRVSDTGLGMDEELLKQVFDPFFTTKEVGKGTGLGLSMVYGIIKSHGGHIICRSEPGRGTDFKLYLPVRAPEADTKETRRIIDLPGEVRGGPETILLVDDEENLRDIGRRTLSHKGYAVLTADSGEKALEIYRENNADIDLVILDISMPGMGGYRALEEILKINPRARVIIASGYSRDSRRAGPIESGAAAFVVKPFRQTDLLKTVRRILDDKQNE